MRLLILILAFLVLFSVQASALNVAVSPRTIAVPLGEERDVKVTVTNDGTSDTGFSLSINTGYGPARISNINPSNVDFDIGRDNTLITVSDIAPSKSVDIYITVVANAGNDDSLMISVHDQGCSGCSPIPESIGVVVSEPVAFSGLDGFWAIILVLSSGLVFWKVAL